MLIDPGSLVNITYLETVKEMGVESQIIRSLSVLVFNNVALDKTIREITLLTYAVGLNIPFKYQEWGIRWLTTHYWEGLGSIV